MQELNPEEIHDLSVVEHRLLLPAPIFAEIRTAVAQQDVRGLTPLQSLLAQATAGEALVQTVAKEFQKLLQTLCEGASRKPVDCFCSLGPKQRTTSLTLADGKLNRQEIEQFWDQQRQTLLNLQDATPAELARLAASDNVVGDFANLVERDENLLRNQEAVLRRLMEAISKLAIVHARYRLETPVLPKINLDSAEALKIAARYRRDWKNNRAAVVDTWRLVEFNANNLMSNLNLVFSGDILNTGDNPFRFRSSDAELRVGFQFDAPLTRLAERNVYRQSLIEFQQARRNLMAYVDGIDRSLRNTLRTINLNYLNFELRRNAVGLAITQVELAQNALREPPKPLAAGQTAEGAARGPTTTRDLVDALSRLLNAQNDFLSVWVNYDVQRMYLDLDLGTMQLDQKGVWIDPVDLINDLPDGDAKSDGDGQDADDDGYDPIADEVDLDLLFKQLEQRDAGAQIETEEVIAPGETMDNFEAPLPSPMNAPPQPGNWPDDAMLEEESAAAEEAREPRRIRFIPPR